MIYTAEKQELIMNHFKEEALIALPEYEDHIFITPVYFNSAQDFAAKAKDTYNLKTYKVKYLMLFFGRFDDSTKKGCEDNPPVFVSYNWQIFRETVEARDGKPNSHDSLVIDLINLTNHFKKSTDIISNKIVSSPLRQVGDMIKVQKCEYVDSNVFGDWINLRITVELNNE